MHLQRKDTICINTIALAFSVLFALPHSFANEATTPAAAPQSNAVSSGETGTRNFYKVLDDVLADFDLDLKNSAVKGLRDVSIRNVATSENVPPSFKNHLELLVSEHILKNTHTRMIQCVRCRARAAKLSGENVVITSPDQSPEELSRIARASGIQNFMDVAFAYQPNGMILSFYITEAETGNVVWSRSYNSETSRAAAVRRGVDYEQVDAVKSASEYMPTSQSRVILYYIFEPDFSGMSGNVGLGFRQVERYDNRKKEVGFELDYLRSGTSLAGGTSDKTIFAGLNLTMLFVHAWNLIGEEENYNKIRGSIYGAIGGTYASKYLGGLIRGGFEWRMARHWSVTTALGYRPPSTSFLESSTSGKSITGVEIGLGVCALF